jgi:hypothetical protein
MGGGTAAMLTMMMREKVSGPAAATQQDTSVQSSLGLQRHCRLPIEQLASRSCATTVFFAQKL